MSRTYRCDEYGRNLRRYNKVRFPFGTPRWWRRMHMTRPLRHENKQLCRNIMRGADSERIIWPLGNHKPHVYYW